MPVPEASVWTDSAWRATADRWVDDQLARLELEPTGEGERIHDRPWSTVIRVPTRGGAVFFKAVIPVLRHEAGLTELLGRRRPDCVPPPLAVNRDEGWLLLEDGGQTLRSIVEADRGIGRWRDVLALYASLQIDLAPDLPELLELGVPDLRLAELPARFEALLAAIGDRLPDNERRRLEASLPWANAACEELASAGIPETIQHDDLHDAQVFVRDGCYRLLDWGDACVSHPFFTLAVTLDGVIQWGADDVEASEPTEVYRDAYLAPFRSLSAADLVDLSATARKLGWLCRAVNSRLSQPSVESTRLRLRMYLDGRA
ncbi:phosphotransferase [Gaiella sp.]|uniref:phosphotransferase n=1 Tax=Gaiella sp. TaxID=2663207 RepID=UPI003263E333